jgi:urate oxidase
MAHLLGHSQYGKAETAVVRVYRDRDPHELVDLNVSVALSGDFADTHLTGDNAKVLTTDAVKNTVFAYAEGARRGGPAARVVRPGARPPLRRRRPAGARGHGCGSSSTRGCACPGRTPSSARGSWCAPPPVTYEDGRAHVVSGLRDLVVLKTTDSEFAGFYEDRYTTLQPTPTASWRPSVTAQWWHTTRTRSTGGPAVRPGARPRCTGAFAASYSLALQQTLFEMGSALLDAVPSAGEVRLSLPNKHHFAVDLSPFGSTTRTRSSSPADRPYGLIEGTVRPRGGAPTRGPPSTRPGLVDRAVRIPASEGQRMTTTDPATARPVHLRRPPSQLHDAIPTRPPSGSRRSTASSTRSARSAPAT